MNTDLVGIWNGTFNTDGLLFTPGLFDQHGRYVGGEGFGGLPKMPMLAWKSCGRVTTRRSTTRSRWRRFMAISLASNRIRFRSVGSSIPTASSNSASIPTALPFPARERALRWRRRIGPSTDSSLLAEAFIPSREDGRRRLGAKAHFSIRSEPSAFAARSALRNARRCTSTRWFNLSGGNHDGVVYEWETHALGLIPEAMLEALKAALLRRS